MRILVVRLGSMGDIIHVLPAVASLKESLPASQITWVVHQKWLPLIRENPYVDEIVPLNRRSLLDVLRCWWTLRSKKFDIAIDFQGLIQSALVAWLASPKRLIGFDECRAREPLAAKFYSERIRTYSKHIVDQYLELARAAGASKTIYAFPVPEGKPEGNLPEEPYVLACPFAGWPAKQWPFHFYTRLGMYLREELNMKLVLNSPPGLARQLEGIPETTLHISGLEGLIYAIRHARGYVGLDSGPTHLAAALGKPGVAIYGPTDPERNGPWGSSIRVLRSPMAKTSYERKQVIDDSMYQISPEAVFAVLKPLLVDQQNRLRQPVS